MARQLLLALGLAAVAAAEMTVTIDGNPAAVAPDDVTNEPLPPLPPPTGPVEVLTLTTFDWRISNGSDWFVKFYAPWCPHCRMMEPEMEKVAGKLAGGDSGLVDGRHVVIAKVDVESELVLGVRFMVSSYPTCVLISDGGRTVRYYKGPRHALALTAFVTSGYEEVRPWCGSGWVGALHPGNPGARGWRHMFQLHPLLWFYRAVELGLGLQSVGFLPNIAFALSMFPVGVVFITALIILVLEGCGHFTGGREAAAAAGRAAREERERMKVAAASQAEGQGDGGDGEDESDDDEDISSEEEVAVEPEGAKEGAAVETKKGR